MNSPKIALKKENPVPDNTSKSLEHSVTNILDQQSLSQKGLSGDILFKNSTNKSLPNIQNDQTSEFDIDVNIRLDFDAPLSYEESEIRIIKLCSIIAAIQFFVILVHLISICILTMENKPQLIIPFEFPNQNIYGTYTEKCFFSK